MPQIELQDFLDHVNRGALIQGGTEQHRFMHEAAQHALQVVAKLNTGYHPPEEVRALLAQLTGQAVDDSVTVFPPVLQRVRQEPEHRQERLHQHRLPVPGHRRHHHRRRHPHRPRQHADNAQPQHRP
jgi:hypothetical protein